MKNLSILTIIILSIGFYSCGLDLGEVIDPIEVETPDIQIIETDIEEATVLSNIEEDPDKVDYFVTKSNWVIESDLTLEPGVVVEFAPGSKMTISEGGYVLAIGTSDEPILFTGEVAEAGSWQGIFTNSLDSRNEFTHCIIEYAGSDEFRWEWSGSKVALLNFGKLRLTNSTIRHTDGSGLGNSGQLQEFSNNIFTSNSGAGVITEAIQVQNLDNASTYDSATNFAGVHVFNWLDDGSPLHEWKNLNGTWYRITENMTVNTGWTIEAGTNIEMAPATSISISSGYIQAVGTSASKIVIRGEVSEAGFWDGIRILSEDNRNEITHSIIQHGGNEELNWYFSKANLALDGKLKMNNTTLSDGAGCGIAMTGDSELNHENTVFENLSSNDICE